VTDDAAFQSFAAAATSPMLIVTTRPADGRPPEGCLVGFSTQCSIDPVHHLVCLSKANETYEVARDATTLAVHFLHETSADRALARLFGEETGHEIDKFTRCSWEEGPDGVPLLDGLDHFVGRVLDRVDLGDHVGFVLAVDGGRAEHADVPLLTYQDVDDLEAGNDA
jgi:flavin reductase (DIM6/NTAB) family NADH-FMN oxidoreductase RutF